jgi:hypothetical protein
MFFTLRGQRDLFLDQSACRWVQRQIRSLGVCVAVRLCEASLTAATQTHALAIIAYLGSRVGA